MSRSNNTEVVNPATRWFEWSGANGTISYYDKELKAKVDVKMPFTFLLLDSLSTIKGYSQSEENGIYSNEVRNTVTDKLIVKIFNKHTIAEGIYQSIKDQVVSAGGKYAKSCYIAFYDDNKQLTIGNLMLMGSSLGGGENKKEKYEVGAWMGFEKANKAEIMKKAIVMEKDERVCLNGATQFYCPKFKLKDVSDETNEKANKLDEELQEYLKAYFARTGTSNATEAESEKVPIAPQSGDDMVNFEPKDKTKTEQPHSFSVHDDDLPF